MSQVVIENPIINSPFEEPTRHFRFDEQGITNQIVVERRISQYFVPIAKPRKTAKERQLTFEEWTEDRIEENKTVVIAMLIIWHVLNKLANPRDARFTAQTLEDMGEVLCYVKDHGLGFLIAYTISGVQRNYMPDFIAVNNAGTWGRWAFIENRDPWNAQSIIREYLAEKSMAEK